MSAARSIASTIDVALLAAWLGGSILFAAVVAPAAFAVLPSRTLAGALIGRVLPGVFLGGIAIAVVSPALGWGASQTGPRRGRLAAAIVMAVSCAVAQFVVGPRIDRIRASIPGAIDSLALDDPRRISFGRLHASSVGWLGLAMLAALTSIVLAALMWSRAESRQ